LKYDPSIIEIPVPRYFKEVEDNIEVKVLLKEPVQRPGTKKTKKASSKKKKGKKKKGDEQQEEKMTLKKQKQFID
jgi:hypothetical protein